MKIKYEISYAKGFGWRKLNKLFNKSEAEKKVSDLKKSGYSACMKQVKID